MIGYIQSRTASDRHDIPSLGTNRLHSRVGVSPPLPRNRQVPVAQSRNISWRHMAGLDPDRQHSAGTRKMNMKIEQGAEMQDKMD